MGQTAMPEADENTRAHRFTLMFSSSSAILRESREPNAAKSHKSHFLCKTMADVQGFHRLLMLTLSPVETHAAMAALLAAMEKRGALALAFYTASCTDAAENAPYVDRGVSRGGMCLAHRDLARWKQVVWCTCGPKMVVRGRLARAVSRIERQCPSPCPPWPAPFAALAGIPDDSCGETWHENCAFPILTARIATVRHV